MTGHALPRWPTRSPNEPAPASPPCCRPTDATWAAEELARRFGVPVVAVRAVGHRRQPLRAPLRPPPDGPAAGSRSTTGATTAPSTRPSPSSTATGSSPAPGSMGPQADVAITTAVLPSTTPTRSTAGSPRATSPACSWSPPSPTSASCCPRPGYLDAVREITRRHGVLLIIDETHTLCAGPGRVHRRLGPRPRLRRGRQGDRRRRARRGVRHDPGVADQLLGPMAMPRSTSPASAAPSPPTPSRWRPSGRRSPPASGRRSSTSPSRSPSASPRAWPT